MIVIQTGDNAIAGNIHSDAERRGAGDRENRFFTVSSLVVGKYIYAAGPGKKLPARLKDHSLPHPKGRTERRRRDHRRSQVILFRLSRKLRRQKKDKAQREESDRKH
jgi:hypothetical protein